MQRESLARRIHELRRAHNKNQDEIAGVLGISSEDYMRLEIGVREVAFVEVEKIADYLSVPYTDITGVDETEAGALKSMYQGCSDDMLKVFDQVETILGVFSAQERLYYRVRESGER